MQRTLLALALIVTAGASYAQTMPGNEPRDPYGRPLVGRNDWVRQPGDQPGSGSGMPANANMNANTYSGATVTTAPSAQPRYAQPGYAQQPAAAVALFTSLSAVADLLQTILAGLYLAGRALAEAAIGNPLAWAAFVLALALTGVWLYLIRRLVPEGTTR